MWGLALFLLAATARTAENPAVESKKYPLPSYGFASPIKDDTRLSNWILTGASSFTPRGLVLLPDLTGVVGSAWHHVPFTSSRFDVEVDVEIKGPAECKSADGFAMWFTEEKSISTVAHPPSPDVWNLLGYRPNPKGFGVLFSTNDRVNNPTSSVSFLYSDGNKTLNSLTDVPTAEGVYVSPRNSGPFHLWLSVSSDSVRGHFKLNSDKDWKVAFVYKLSPADKSKFTGYLGFTSSNRRIAKGETGLALNTATGDEVVITRLRVTTEDGDLASREGLPGQEELHKALLSSDSNSQIEALLQALTQHILPKQDILLNELGRLQHGNRLLSDRVDTLYNFLTKGASDEKMKEALEALKNFVFKSSRDNANKLDELHGKLEGQSVEELKQRSAELETTVRAATTLSTYITVGLGVIFVLFGVVIYKRMRDIEKKHLL